MIAVLWVLLAGAASAQTEACSGPLTADFLRESMDDVDAAITEFNGERARNLLDELVYELRCLDRPIDPRDLGRLARQRSLLSFYEQDLLETETWALLARSTLGGAPWPETLPIPPSYFATVDALPEPAVAGVEGKGIAPPKKGAVLLDGRLVVEPRSALGMSHLLQVADRRGVVEQTEWQHGAAFPEEVLGAPVEVRPPRWYDEPPSPVPAPVAPEPPPVPQPIEPPPGEPEVVPPEPEEPAVAVAEEVRDKMFRSREATDGCPWKKDPKTAEANAGSVRINRHEYDVRTRVEQAEFRKVLRSCGEFRAARRFERWRDARRKLALDAGRYKRSMVRALLTEEPRRRPPRAPGE